jgi:hypothetical protein
MCHLTIFVINYFKIQKMEKFTTQEEINEFNKLREKKKKRPMIIIRNIAIGIFAFTILLIIIIPEPTPEEIARQELLKVEEVKQEEFVRLRELGLTEEKIKDSLRSRQVSELFSAWSGDHIKLKAKIQEGLNDPESYESISTKYWDMDSIIVIKTIFTAKNQYGGVEKFIIRAESDINGNIIKLN